jgi:hypothetical protein
MNIPCISIERKTKRYAIFDGFSCVRTFMDYTDEAQAIADGRAWIAERTDVEPEITYPNITRMTVSRTRK